MLTAYDVSVRNRFEISDVAVPLYAAISNRNKSKSVVYKVFVKSLRRSLRLMRHIHIEFEIILPDNRESVHRGNIDKSRALSWRAGAIDHDFFEL